MSEPLLLSPEQAAELLAVKRTTLFHLMATGAIESIKVGRLRRVPHDALEAYVRKQREAQGAAR